MELACRDDAPFSKHLWMSFTLLATQAAETRDHMHVYRLAYPGACRFDLVVERGKVRNLVQLAEIDKYIP